MVRIGSVGSPILSPQQGISRLTRTLSGYLIGASRLSQSPASNLGKIKIRANWDELKKEFDARRIAIGYVVDEVIDGVISLLPTSSSGGGAPLIATVSANQISSPDQLITYSTYNSGLSPRVSYVRGDAWALFNRTLASGYTKKSSLTKYQVGMTTVSFSPGSSSTPPTITISNSVRTNKIVVIR